MDNRRNGPISIGTAAFCTTIVIIVVFIALWDQRAIVAWIVLGMLGLITLTGCILYALRQVNEMTIRHSRYQQETGTPLTYTGYAGMYPRNSLID